MEDMTQLPSTTSETMKLVKDAWRQTNEESLAIKKNNTEIQKNSNGFRLDHIDSSIIGEDCKKRGTPTKVDQGLSPIKITSEMNESQIKQ